MAYVVLSVQWFANQLQYYLKTYATPIRSTTYLSHRFAQKKSHKYKERFINNNSSNDKFLSVALFRAHYGTADVQGQKDDITCHKYNIWHIPGKKKKHQWLNLKMVLTHPLWASADHTPAHGTAHPLKTSNSVNNSILTCVLQVQKRFFLISPTTENDSTKIQEVSLRYT